MSPRKHQYAGVGEKGIATVELRLLSKCHRKVKWGEGIFRATSFHDQWSEELDTPLALKQTPP